jgi:hypothetical protein
MKSKTSNLTRMGMLLGLTAITALCMATPIRAETGRAPERPSASGKPSHDGGIPYPTASTVSQLIADINYANKVGGAITINLAPGTTFGLKSADNTTDGGNGLPVIGATKVVELTIIGNGAIIERVGGYTISRRGVSNGFRLFDVAVGASLTLDHVTLQGGWAYGSAGGAIYNQGTLNINNGCILSGNSAGAGGAIFNNGGTVTVNNSTVAGNRVTSVGGGIYNSGGTITVNNGSTLSGNGAASIGGGIYNSDGTATISASSLSGNSARFGGGIYNSGGTVTMSNGSTLSNNAAYHADYPWAGGDGGGIYNDTGTVTINSSILSGNTADVNFGTGGGIYNHGGAVAVENYSSITGNTDSDVNNHSVLYLDSTSMIGILGGNSAIPI